MAHRARRRTRRRRWRRQEIPVWMVLVIVIAGGFGVSLAITATPSGQMIESSGSTAFLTNGEIAGMQFAARHTRSEGPVCSDPDRESIVVQGTCKTGNTIKTDYCFSDESVVEFTCRANRCVQNLINCVEHGYSGCQNGACVNVTNMTATAGNMTNTTGIPGLIDIPNNGTNVSLPDLLVASLSYSVGNGTNNTNATVTITAVVRNQGSAAASSSFTEFRILSLQNFVPTNYLFAGTSTQVVTTFTLPHNTYALTVTADANSQVEESDETNNQATLNVVV